LESLVLKFASVVGDIFDVQTLNKVHPFKESLSSEKLMKVLQDLDAQDAIEVLDISEFNIQYRFTHPFMREALYQRMTYNHRRVLHRAVAEAL
jgi:adenylate cyclase 10